MQDHPRSRGVYHELLPPSLGSHWIIPARAGFTQPRGGPRSTRRDHPRSRGVYRRISVSHVRRAGSSPLARGLHSWGYTGHTAARIIPARAGFTPCLMGDRYGLGDHPRSRGVYGTGPLRLMSPLGSSPLARGLLSPPVTSVTSARIIPARAGFTDRIPGDGVEAEDHPRSRGVYRNEVTATDVAGGSSPLARGLPGEVIL